VRIPFSKALTEEGHGGQTYTLTGPALISFYDVAEDLSKTLGREVNYVGISLELSKKFMLHMNLLEWVADALNEYFEAYSEGYGDFTTNEVERLMGRLAASYKKFASAFARVFGGDQSHSW
jgi:hypothetical protein